MDDRHLIAYGLIGLMALAAIIAVILMRQKWREGRRIRRGGRPG